MSPKNVEQLIRKAEEQHKKKLAALKEQQRREDARVDAEVLRWLKAEQPEQWATWREAAAERLSARAAKRSAAAKRARAGAEQPEAQQDQPVPVSPEVPEHMDR